jgi:uncharacterized membrane protein HdeD (DUF308 family)
MPPASDTTRLLNVNDEAAVVSRLAASPEEVADNWQYIMVTGVVDTLVGTVCLFAPVATTQVVSTALVALIFVAGCFNLSTVFCSERGYQHQFFWVGVVEVLIALLMYFHRFGTVTLLTILIAFAFMVFGSVEMTVAQQNDRMAARSLTFFSGILTLILSVLIILSMPTGRWDTIGVLLGANLLNIGVCRIIVAFYGRTLA